MTTRLTAVRLGTPTGAGALAVAAALALLSASGGAAAPRNSSSQFAAERTVFADTFSANTLDRQKWDSLWGRQRVRRGRAELSSTPPVSQAQTFSSLVVSRQTWANMVFSLDLVTVAQLRTTAPNVWEVPWVMFSYRDLAHYYWLILKPNGWELGKKNGGALDGDAAQRFLASGSAPVFPIGHRYHVELLVDSGTITATVNDRRLFRYTDPDPLPGGAVGLYEEDSIAAFDNVSVSPLSQERP